MIIDSGCLESSAPVDLVVSNEAALSRGDDIVDTPSMRGRWGEDEAQTPSVDRGLAVYAFPE